MPFWIFWKIYFFEILIGHESDSLETWHASSRDPHGKKVIKRILISDSRLQQDAKTFEVGGATFTKIAVTLEWNEIFSPNSEHMWMSSIFGQIDLLVVL